MSEISEKLQKKEVFAKSRMLFNWLEDILVKFKIII
jgi:hypothetical protein